MTPHSHNRDMCFICDGGTFEGVERGVDLSILVYGWHLAMVDDAMPWSYRIGLTESFDHPELVVVDMELEAEQRLINMAVRLIERDGQLKPDELSKCGIEVVTVHDNHLHGEWFGQWCNRYDTEPPTGSFLQLLAPTDWICDSHGHAARRLDRPAIGPGANRAARRASRKRPGPGHRSN